MTPAPSGVRIEPVAGPVTIDVRSEPLPVDAEHTERVDRAWRAMCADNPRYFDGRILSFESYDPAAGRAAARDVAYRYHAARGTVDSGVVFFGITGLIRVGGLYLLGKRGGSVHDYPGRWEFAPCGGIDPPPEGRAASLTPEDIARELRREAREELGLDLSATQPRPIALVHDDPAGSTDLMMLIEPGTRPDAGPGAGPNWDPNWEYSQTRWLTLGQIRDLDRSAEGGVIPTTLAMAEHLRSVPPRR